MEFFWLAAAAMAANWAFFLLATRYSPLRNGIDYCCRLDAEGKWAKLSVALVQIFQRKGAMREDTMRPGQLPSRSLLRFAVVIAVVPQDLFLVLFDLGDEPLARLTERTGVLAIMNTLTQCLLAFPEPMITSMASLCKGQLLWAHVLLATVSALEIGVHVCCVLSRMRSPQGRSAVAEASVADEM